MDIWRLIENQIVALAQGHSNLGNSPAASTMPLVLAVLLYSEDVLTEPEYEMIRRLKRLRDRATHIAGFEVSPDEAVIYVEVASRLMSSLEPKLKLSELVQEQRRRREKEQGAGL